MSPARRLKNMAERKHIPSHTKLRLFSAAAGHCQRPACLETLFPDEMGGEKHIAEMAHVIPHGEKGPREDERPAGDFEVDGFENLLLLCPTCHTIIDKNPEAYSRSTLLGWKNNHLSALAQKQGICAYDDRAGGRLAIVGAMAENKAIWDELAPFEGANADLDPESEAAKAWSHRMRNVILPNHFRIQAIVKANLHHMMDAELATFARYQEHVRGLAERHVCGIAGRAIRYPTKMDEILA